MNLPPNMAWGNTRIGSTPPTIGYPGFMNINRIQQTQVSVTKIMGNHNAKAGFYFEHSYKAQNAQNNVNFNGNLNVGIDTSNPFDTQMAFSNLATGVFNTYAQATRFLEGNWAYNNVEFYLQDNWKVTPRLTLDYGARFVHQTPNQDKFNHVANFFQGGNEGDELRADVPASALYDIAQGPLPVRAGLREQRGDLLGREPGGQGSAHGRAPAVRLGWPGGLGHSQQRR